jgi:hypothetical protein
LIAVASVISISIRNPSLAIKVEEKKKNVKCVFNAKSNGQFQTVHAHLLCWAKLNHRMDPSTPPPKWNWFLAMAQQKVPSLYRMLSTTYLIGSNYAAQFCCPLQFCQIFTNLPFLSLTQP